MPTKAQIRIISSALDQTEDLTEWEVDFINSLADLPPEYLLSEKQEEVLDRINDKL